MPACQSGSRRRCSERPSCADIESACFQNTGDRAVQTISAENLVQLSERDFSAFTLALIQPAIVDDTVAARFLEAHRRAAR